MSAKRPGMKATKADCVGCRDNFYNGNNEYGVTECWSLRNARLARRLLIPVDLRPPYNRKATQLVPECYRKQRYATVDPDKSLDEKGFWKS